MVLTLTRAFDLTGNRAYLDQAVSLYRDIIGGWDSTGGAPGGIWWNRGRGQKATASNGGPVVAGARLAARTGDMSHLAFARKVYDFWFSKMVNPATYEVADHMSAAGVVSWGRLTYNEGIMIGAAQALYVATGQASFLTHAHGFAHSLIASKAVPTSVGPVLTDGTNALCTGDCPQWKGIGYRYLALLFAQEQRPEYRTVLEASINAAWTLARNTSTGRFANDWRGPTTSAASIEAQSSSATALSLYASLCGPYP
jgi:predicted alpha-1,6-mannanase (GH76 family)